MKKHDYNEATESAIDVTLLPKVMQVRDFGKRSRTKYTHLLDQDTTVGNGGFGGATPKPGAKPFEQGQGCFNCGGCECPLVRFAREATASNPLLSVGHQAANCPKAGTPTWYVPFAHARILHTDLAIQL